MAAFQDWSIELDDYVSGLCWSPDGTMLAASTASGTISVMDALTGMESQYFQAHEQPIMALAWSPDGKRLASAAQDGTAKLWNPHAISQTDDPYDGELLAILEAGVSKHTWVEYIAWSFDGNYIATASGKRSRIWSADGTLVQSIESPFKRTISALHWHPYLLEFAVASFGGAALYTIDSTEPKTTLPLESSILALAWSPDATVLAAGLQENAVHFWRLPYAEGRESVMRGYPEKITRLTFDFKSRHLATPSGTAIIVWKFMGDGPEGTEPIVLEGHAGRVTQAKFQHRGELFVSGDETGAIILFSPNESKQPLKAETYQQEISQVVWSPDDKLLAVGTAKGVVDVWQVNV